ncbi:MAG: hypothetical protein JW716_00090 [Candidatus Aenigmarchaeota archaeon]|nr:hypothetical protein [Candidatus Aenigmarchaeota archaeon]
MKHILAIFVVAVFALSVFSVSIFAEGNNAPDGSGNQDPGAQPELYDDTGNSPDPELVSTPINTENQGDDTRLRVCADFLRKNRLSSTPLITCQKMFRNEIRCQEHLEGLGVVDAGAKCGRLFQEGAQIIKERAYVAQKVTQAVAEWRLKKADGLIEKNPSAETVLQALSEEKAKVFMHMTRAQQAEMVRMGKDRVIQEMEKYKLQKTPVQNLYQKRTIASEKLQKAHQNYEHAKGEFIKVNNAYNENRKLFLDVKTQLQKCEGVDSEECTQLMQRAHERAQEFTINAAQMAIRHLEKVKYKAESSEGMEEETAGGILNELNTAINDLEGVVAEVESAQTKEEIQTAAQKISQIWSRIRHREKVHSAELLNAGIWGITKRSETLEERIDAKLAKMSEEGLDVSELQTRLDEYSVKVVSAKEKYEQAKEILQQANGMRGDELTEEEKEEAIGLVEQAKDLIRQAHEELKDAHDFIKDIIKEIGGLGEDVTDVESETEEGLDEGEVYEVVESEE